MRIDAVSIFPEYLAPLDLSLVGRARRSGLLDVRVHDLRDWTEDRHRTTDDTPYGGGAGMVMKPEPWGKALDAIAPSAAGASPPLLVVPTPSGRPFTQELAERLSRREWLVFACGRYEGIDQRVIDDAGTRMEVLEVSIGDYVLNGGEVAALVVIEAVVRLLPGFMGNPESLSEESHAAGEGGRLLEYPVYTRPASWRGLDVPEVLLGGDHTRIASWRHDLAVRRTARRRPDLAHGSQSLDVSEMDGLVQVAEPADAPEILTLQRACWMQEAMVNDSLHIPPLLESLDDVRAGLGQWTTFVVRSHGRLVASVRGRLNVDVWEVGRLMVAPDLQGRGMGRWLLEYAEQAAPPGTAGFSLFTGVGSADNLRMYRRAGYRRRQDDPAAPGVVVLTKRRREPR